MVELLETVCPKYKRRINKARCAPDIGEDHVVSLDIYLETCIMVLLNIDCKSSIISFENSQYSNKGNFLVAGM